MPRTAAAPRAAMLRTTRALSWRFERPLDPDAPFKVVFSGERHFLAALPLTRAALADDGVALVQAPTESLAAAVADAQVVIPFMERLDAAILEAGTDVRLVVQFGVGLEGVDRDACRRLGIALSNCPARASGNAAATAEHAVFLALAMLRRGPEELAARFAAGVLGGLPLPRQLEGKRALVVGHGSVGSALAARLRGAWGVDVVVAHAHRAWRDGETDLEAVGGRAEVLETLPSCDVVFLACPLTASTRAFVDDEFCDCLKPGAVVVNVARGPVASRDAVLAALDRDPALTYASDVGAGAASKPAEPWDPADALSRHPRTYFSPHVGGYTDVSYANTARLVADAVARVRDRRPPDVWLNGP